MTYRKSLQQSQGLSLTSFVMIMGITGIIAYRVAPPPGYTAQGILSVNQPAVSFSKTSLAILKQGEQLTPQVLLADNVMEAVAEFVQGQPERIREQTALRMSQNPLIILVQYRSNQEALSLKATEGLMKAMMEQSRLINVSRWEQIHQATQKRSQEVLKELKAAENQLDSYNQLDQREVDRLEKQVKLKQDTYDQVQSTLNDVKAAEKEMISSLMIRQDSQIIAKPGSNPIVKVTLGIGFIVSLLVSLGLIPSLTIWKEAKRKKQRETDRLQAIFYRLILQGNGKISLTRFAMESKIAPELAQNYLNRQAEILNGTCEVKEEGSIFYYFSL